MDLGIGVGSKNEVQKKDLSLHLVGLEVGMEDSVWGVLESKKKK